MRSMPRAVWPLVLTLTLGIPGLLAAQARRPLDARRLAALKAEAVADVQAMAGFTQRMVDQIFSFGELGFQEVETSRYLKAVLREHGFTVKENVGGMPTAWTATWGSGKPVIALGSDIDGIPQSSQKPGVAYHDPLVPGAPGHGEGHNSGQAVIVTAAVAVQKLMERDGLPGTLVIWPGVAEELVAAKAYLVREGVFRDVDVTIFTHVDNGFSTGYGDASGSGLVSMEYTFTGETAHSAGAPWRGRSALDAVELLNVAWNYRREHLRPQHRVHYVVTNGGDQPNVVPREATVWYYLRETDYEHIKELKDMGDAMAHAAATMTGTTLSRVRILGTAYPRHFNRPVAEALQRNIAAVGMPAWSEADQTLARAVQRELGVRERGLNTAVDSLERGVSPDENRGGGSDDIGDISWVTPTVTLRFPSNIPNLPGHHWSNAIAMATPIAHKGATAGAKATAMTVLDLIATPALVDSAWSYFRNVQTKDRTYIPFIAAADQPPIELNTGIMAKYREAMRKYYYDPSRYTTYLDQLGITYPTVRPAAPGGETPR
jgi:aminobenzoyl-glutamate utilization protein B